MTSWKLVMYTKRFFKTWISYIHSTKPASTRLVVTREKRSVQLLSATFHIYYSLLIWSIGKWAEGKFWISKRSTKRNSQFRGVQSSQTPSCRRHRTWRACRPRRCPSGRARRRRGRWSRPGCRHRASSRRCRRKLVSWSRTARGPGASPGDSGRGTARRARCATVIWCRSTSRARRPASRLRPRGSLRVLLLLLLVLRLPGGPGRSLRSKSPATGRISLYRGSAPSWKAKSTKSTRLD